MSCPVKDQLLHVFYYYLPPFFLKKKCQQIFKKKIYLYHK